MRIQGLVFMPRFVQKKSMLRSARVKFSKSTLKLFFKQLKNSFLRHELEQLRIDIYELSLLYYIFWNYTPTFRVYLNLNFSPMR